MASGDSHNAMAVDNGLAEGRAGLSRWCTQHLPHDARAGGEAHPVASLALWARPGRRLGGQATRRHARCPDARRQDWARAAAIRLPLQLIRGKLQHDKSAATQEYADRLALAVQGLGSAVELLGHTDDVPAAMEQVGVVLSSSTRESFHIGLVEGAASGAVPVVRDWPFFPGAARSLFPADWVVDDPAAAAERILAVTSTDSAWRQAGRAASEHVIGRWDWPIVRGRYEQLLRA